MLFLGDGEDVRRYIVYLYKHVHRILHRGAKIFCFEWEKQYLTKNGVRDKTIHETFCFTFLAENREHREGHYDEDTS